MSGTIQRVSRWAAWAILACYTAFNFFRHGIDAYTVVVLLFSALWCAAFWLIETRTARPVRTYGYLALASSVVAAFFIAAPAAQHGDPTMGAIAWAGVTILGLVWCIYYERTAASV